MPVGEITWFNSTTGKGLIAPEAGGNPVEFTVKPDQVEKPEASALIGSKVEFQVGASPESTIDIVKFFQDR